MYICHCVCFLLVVPRRTSFRRNVFLGLPEPPRLPSSHYFPRQKTLPGRQTTIDKMPPQWEEEGDDLYKEGNEESTFLHEHEEDMTKTKQNKHRGRSRREK